VEVGPMGGSTSCIGSRTGHADGDDADINALGSARGSVCGNLGGGDEHDVAACECTCTWCKREYHQTECPCGKRGYCDTLCLCARYACCLRVGNIVSCMKERTC
jgi:hypothetical protein